MKATCNLVKFGRVTADMLAGRQTHRPDMELGSHFVTQRLSDPGIQRPGDPVDPVTDPVL